MGPWWIKQRSHIFPDPSRPVRTLDFLVCPGIPFDSFRSVLDTCFSKGLAGIYMKDMCPGQRGSSGGAWASKQSSEAGACSPEHGSWLIL